MADHTPKRQPAYPRALAAFEAMKKQPNRIWTTTELGEAIPRNLRVGNDNSAGVGTTIRYIFSEQTPFTEEVTIVQQGRYYLAKLAHPEKYLDKKPKVEEQSRPAVEDMGKEPRPATPGPMSAGLPQHLADKIEPAIKSREAGEMGFLLGQILGWHQAQRL